MPEKYNNYPPTTGKVKRDDESIVDIAKVYCQCANAIRSISPEDSEVFDGSVNKAQLKFTLAAGATRYLMFKTPPATLENPLYVIWAKDFIKSDVNNFDYALYSNVDQTGITPGALQPIINENQPMRSFAPSQSLLYPTPTGITDLVLPATKLIDQDVILGGQGTARSTGGGTPGTRFMILDPDSWHVIRFHNNDTQNVANAFITSVFIEALLPVLYARTHP